MFPLALMNQELHAILCFNRKIKDILEKLKTINVSIFTFDDLEQLNALIESQKPAVATESEKVPTFKNFILV